MQQPAVPPLTGPEAIAHALGKIDLDRIEAEQREVIRAKKKTARPRAVRLLRIVAGMRRNGVQPSDLVTDSIPVIPPAFRPFSITGNTFLPGDANELYRDLVEYRDLLKKTETELGGEAAAPVYEAMNQSVRALYGYGESPNPKIKARSVKGFFDVVTGTSPKYSWYQSKMLAKPVDGVSRGVIIPDADLSMNEIGIPEEHAWSMYGSHIQRQLVLGGMSPAGALRALRDRSDVAKKALSKAMSERPVVATRAPAWHKYSVIGQYPRIVDGDAIRINTFISQGLGADFDGDSGRFWLTIIKKCDAGPDVPCAEQTVRLATTSVRIEEIPYLTASAVRLSDTVTEFDVAPDIAVLAYDREAGRQGIYAITKFSIHEHLRMRSVTVGKDAFLASDDHSLVAFSREENRVSVVTPAQVVTCKSTANLHAPCAAKGFVEDTRAGFLEGPRGSTKATADLGFALGIYAGDGAFSRSSKRKQATHMRAARTLHALFGCKSDEPGYEEYARVSLGGRPGSSGRTSFHAGEGQVAMVAGYEWLKRLCGDDAEGKSLPSCMLDLCWDFRWGLFCGVLASDGTVSVARGKEQPQLLVGLNSVVSLRFATDLMALCSSLGIRSGLTEAKRKTATGNPEYSVAISTADLAALYAKGGLDFGCAERQTIMDEYLPTIRIENSADNIPFPGGDLAQAIKDAIWDMSGRPMRAAKTKRNFGPATVWDSRGVWHRTVFKREYERIGAWLEQARPEVMDSWNHYLKIMLNDEIRWEEIRVGEGEIHGTGYDITVPGPLTFATANGTFVQDTMAIHLPTTPEAVRDVKEKMMPDKMVWSVKDRSQVMAAPKHEQILGLNTTGGQKRKFRNEAEVITALEAGEISPADEVELG